MTIVRPGDYIGYAKVEGPPFNWNQLRIIDANGHEMKEVIEVNAEDGWLIRYKTDDYGYIIVDRLKGEAVTERIEGEFRIEVRS